MSLVCLPLSAGEDTFELHSVELELEAVGKQIRDLQVKQAELRERKAVLESSRSVAHLSQFAVVQWFSGEDAGMYSEVETDAIRKYDDTKMDEDGYPQTDYSVAVEWQKGKKPKHGWPVYAASMKFVSSK
ncbi:uncharacterized protein LOC113052213, partial [Tachysurus ichikawai]